MAVVQKLVAAREIMHKGVITIKSSQTLFEAANKMVANDIGSLVVVENNKPVGIITESNFLKFAAKSVNIKRTAVKEAMSKPLITCGPDATLLDVVGLMKTKKVRHIPVIEKGKLIGIISASDVAWRGVPIVLAKP